MSQTSTARAPLAGSPSRRAGAARQGGLSRPGRGGLAPLRVVPAAIERTGTPAFTALCLALLALGLATLLMLNTSLAQGAFTLSSLQARSGVLTDTTEQLTASIDDQGSPRNLAARAQQLGMVPAQSMAFIRLSDGAILGTATPASPLQRLTIIGSPVAPPPAPAVTPTPTPSATASPTPSATASPASPTPAASATGKPTSKPSAPATPTTPSTTASR